MVPEKRRLWAEEGGCRNGGGGGGGGGFQKKGKRAGFRGKEAEERLEGK